MIEIIATAFVTFVVVVDPVGVVPMFVSLSADLSKEERRRMALRATAVAAIVLIVFAFAGNPLLRAMGISFPAFRIAGGALLLLLAVDMVFARYTGLRATTESEDKEAARRHDFSVFPLAIPLIAGPGSISSIMLLTAAHSGAPAEQLAITLVMLCVLVVNLFALVAASSVMKFLGYTGINVIGRVFGILLAALSVQFILDGIRDAFG